MKNLSILTVIISIFTFSSCEEESIIGCTDLSAINYDAAATESNNSCEYVSDQILGSWTLDSANVNMLYSEEMLNLLIIESSMYTPYEFEDEMGFPMPSSQTEWDYIALNGVPLDLDMSNFPDLILITNSTFTINESNEVTELDYQLINDQTIEFSSNEEDIEYFDIVEVSESNLVLTSTSLIENPQDMGASEIMMVIYLSK